VRSLNKALKPVQGKIFCSWGNHAGKLSGSVISWLIGIIYISGLLSACTHSSWPDLPVTIEPGQLSKGNDSFGIYYTYMPINLPQQPEILVLVHGTPPKDGTAESNTEYYITSWMDFAEEQGYILIAPVFNQENFSSRLGDHALSGYRGLFGREIGADEWVLRLVRAHQQAVGLANDGFYLYGHSAGGQFVARFLVTHPEYIKKAIITSAATYPQPNPEVAWPFGLGEIHTEIEWDAETVIPVDIVPDHWTWLAATQIPLTVIVGLDDTAELPTYLIPGQKGKNRYTIAQNWINDMATFAETYGLQSRFQLELIPGVGHSMSGLIPYSQQAFRDP